MYKDWKKDWKKFQSFFQSLFQYFFQYFVSPQEMSRKSARNWILVLSFLWSCGKMNKKIKKKDYISSIIFSIFFPIFFSIFLAIFPYDHRKHSTEIQFRADFSLISCGEKKDWKKDWKNDWKKDWNFFQ